MLQKLNERIQGVVAWIVIVLVAITFTLFGIDYYMQSRRESIAQVDVNGQPITKQAFELSYRRTRQLREPAQMTAASENQLKQQVLNEMIMNSVSVQAAHSSGFDVNSAQANAAIVSIPQFQMDGRFSTDRYAQALNGAFFTPESFHQEVRQGMLLNQQRFALIGTSFALPGEIKQFVKLSMQTRDYDYLQIPALRFLKSTNVTDQEISGYYQQHKKVFLTPEMVSIDYVRLSMQTIKNAITITPTQISHHYDDNQTNYMAPAQWQVAHILIAVPENASIEDQQGIKQQAEQVYHLLQKQPAQFDEKMRSLSADKVSAMNGGVLPWIVAGQSEFDKALVNLTIPGQISAPLKSRNGYEIFKLVAYKPATPKPLSEVQANIKEQLQTELAQTKYTQALEQLSDLSYQTPDSLGPVADALKLKVEHSPLFSRRGGESALTQNKQIIQAAFSHDVLEFGNNSDPIQLDNDGVLVLRVSKHISAAAKTLVDVKLLIAEKLAHKKAEAEAKQLGAEFLKASQTVTQQEKLIQINQLKWNEISNAARDADNPSAVINELAFRIPKVRANEGLSLVGGDYVIVHLKKINDGHLELLDKEQVASITQQIEANYGLMDYDLYINGLMNQAAIVKH